MAETVPRHVGDEPTEGVERSHDEDVRHEDVELLGKSFRVRQIVDNLGNQRTRMWERTVASARNGLDLPGKKVLEFRHNRAERKHNEANDDHQNLLNKHADARRDIEDSDISGRLKRRRLDRLEKKQKRQVDRSQAKINKWAGRHTERKSALDKRANSMRERKERVDTNYERRRAEMVKNLLGRKHMAEGRKALRAQLRAEGARHLWHNDVRGILKEIPDHQMRRVGEIAVRAQMSRDAEMRSRFAAEDSVRSAQRAHEKVIANRDEAAQTLNRISVTEKKAVGLRGNIQKSEKDIEAMSDELKFMADDDPEHAVLSAKIELEKQQLEDQELELEMTEKQIASYQDSHTGLLNEKDKLMQQVSDTDIEAELAQIAHDKHQKVADDMAAEHADAVKQVLDSDERK